MAKGLSVPLEHEILQGLPSDLEAAERALVFADSATSEHLRARAFRLEAQPTP